MTRRLSLIIETPGEDPRCVSFDHLPVVVGRDEGAEIQIDEPKVSRRHARFIEDGAGVAIEDLGSSNGTEVDHVSVQQAHLHRGSRIQVGDTVLTVLGDSTGVAATPLQPVAAVAPSIPVPRPEPDAAPAAPRPRSDPRKWSPRAKLLSAVITVLIFGGCHFGLLFFWQQCSQVRPDRGPSDLPDLALPGSGSSGSASSGGGAPKDPGTGTQTPTPPVRGFADEVRDLILDERYASASDRLVQATDDERATAEWKDLAEKVDALWLDSARVRLGVVDRLVLAGRMEEAKKELATAREGLHPSFVSEALRLEKAISADPSSRPSSGSGEAAVEPKPAIDPALIERALATPLRTDLVAAALAQGGDDPAHAVARRWLAAFAKVPGDLAERVDQAAPEGMSLVTRDGTTLIAVSVKEREGRHGVLARDGGAFLGLDQLAEASLLKATDGLPATLDRYLVRMRWHEVQGDFADAWFDLEGAILLLDGEPGLQADLEQKRQRLLRLLRPR